MSMRSGTEFLRTSEDLPLHRIRHERRKRKMRRSMLFLPGNTPNMIINGDALGADSIILDLEDAVSPDEKDSARLLVRSAMKNMGFAGCEITVRINSIDTDYWKDDLEAVIPLKPDLIMPPKASCAEDMRIIDEYIAGIERRCGMEVGTSREAKRS